MKAHKTHEIFDIPLAALSLSEIPSTIIALIKKPGRKTFFYVNAHCINLTRHDVEYKTILKEASLVYSGGIGPILASKILQKSLKQRTPTPDFIYTVLEEAEKQKWSLFFLGSTDTVLEKMIVIFKNRFPKLIIAGSHHGFFKEKEEKKIQQQINKNKPTIILVGMGSPLQEKWIASNKDVVNAQVFWAVGALFDVLSGSIPRAPKLWQQLGIEWLYRLIKEPRRLWKRYIIGNVFFTTLVFKKKFFNKTN